MTFANHRDLVYTEVLGKAAFLEDGAALAGYRDVITRLVKRAPGREATRESLLGLADELSGRTSAR
jgi:hypothetical protein